MADDTLTPAPSFGGVPMNYASPQAIQQAYMQLLRQKRQNQPMAAYYHPLAAVGDIAETVSEEMRLNRLLGGAAQQTAASTGTVPGLPGGDQSAAPAPQSSVPSSPPSMGGSVPRIPGYEPTANPRLPTSTKQEAAAVNSGNWKPTSDYEEGLKLAASSLNNPPPGGATMGGQPGATAEQIIPGGGTVASAGGTP